ncbi:Cell division inhibition protein DicB [Escherichia coli]
MITYVTCDDVDNAFGNAWTSENAKNKAVLMANAWLGNDSNLLIVFYVQIMPDDFVMQLHRF